MSNRPDQINTGFRDFLHTVKSDRAAWFAWMGIALVVLFFYGIYPMFGPENKHSALAWLRSTWKAETDYQHGYFIPVIIAGLLWYDRKRYLESDTSSSKWGIALILIAVVLFILSKRTVQARLAVGSLPILIFGISSYLWGWKVTRLLLIPVGLIYLAIPIPGWLQMTNSLQLFASKAAYHISSALGADIILEGNNISSKTDAWPGFHIAEGCSGVRSLVALTTVAVVYGYIVNRDLWKVAVLFVASIPIAIVANGIRVTSIILIAEYLDPQFAARTYHNWSGFVFFLIIGLVGISIVSFIMEKGWRAVFQRKRKVVTQVNRTEKDAVRET